VDGARLADISCVILHYKLTEREDSPFWQRMRAMDVPDTLNQRFELFRSSGRFFKHNAQELFAEESWVQVLLGQGFEMRPDPVTQFVADEELVARSQGGDMDSFNQLVVRWERPIYALAYRTIGREEDARDVCQETFLRAFRALKGFKGQAKFSSWLYRIALNLCRDWIRRERRQPVAQAPEGVDLIELASETTPSESICGNPDIFSLRNS